MTNQQGLALLFLAGGVLATTGGVLRIVARSSGARWTLAKPRPRVFTLIAVVLLAGFTLRIGGLADKTLSHPEIYVPGIPLPPDISEPPPRTDSVPFLLSWHFHDEPHPPAYYFLMWLWTKVFGWSVWSLRLPSALFGVACIGVVFLMARAIHGLAAGFIAAALIAFNGHQIFWSQTARMYTMTCLLGLISTWLWLRLLNAAEEDRWRELGYVGVTVLCAATDAFAWPLLAGHILGTLWLASGPTSRRILTLQSMVLMLGSPLWAHAIYRARPSPLGAPDWVFLRDYVGFGFLFRNEGDAVVGPSVPILLSAAAALVGLLLFANGAIAGWNTRSDPESPPNPFAAGPLATVAVGSALVTLSLSLLAWRRQGRVALAALLPLLSLLLPSILTRLQPFIKRLPKRFLPSPFVILALVPPIFVFLVSFNVPLLADRLFLIFTPYLLIVIAAGIAALGSKRTLSAALLVPLVLLHGKSIAFYRDLPTSDIDYQELGRRLAPEMRPHDLLFVLKRDWISTPAFYYLIDTQPNYVAQGYREAVDTHPHSRVWVIEMTWAPRSQEMTDALAGFECRQQVRAMNATASLFVRKTPGT